METYDIERVDVFCVFHRRLEGTQDSGVRMGIIENEEVSLSV